MNEESDRSAFIVQLSQFLAGRRIVLVGGKGGVGKTTVACAIALRRAHEQRTILFTTDPASNLGDIFGEARSQPDNLPANLPANLVVETLNAEQLYAHFLE